MMGRKRRVAPSIAASTTGYPLARSWLMYSTITTPVWTEQPKKAMNPTPEETLKCVPVTRSARSPPMRATATLTMWRQAHLAEPNAP